MDIGFIGLGLMGRAMAANLVRAGHNVRVWNRTPGAATDELAKLGAKPVASAGEAFRGDAVITMLANDAALRATLIDGGLLAGARGTVHVNAATVSVALAKELTALHEMAGVGYVAAPVFGRPDAAAAAKLNIVAAGKPEALARVQPLLDWTESDIWRYIQKNNIPIPQMYFAREGKRYRSLGCWPITKPVDSNAATIDEIIAELAVTKTSERAGRAQDHHERNAMQKLRAKGFM